MKPSDLNNPIQRKVAEFVEQNLTPQTSFNDGLLFARSLLDSGLVAMLTIVGEEKTTLAIEAILTLMAGREPHEP